MKEESNLVVRIGSAESFQSDHGEESPTAFEILRVC